MNIELKFDYYSCVVFIPDVIDIDTKKLQLSFLDWVSDQPECISGKKIMILSYDENDFIRYVNDVLLHDVGGKAYKINNSKHRRINGVIKFLFIYNSKRGVSMSYRTSIKKGR